MMDRLEDLLAARDRLKVELVEADKAICRHPEYIRRQFVHNPLWEMGRFEALVARVEFAKKLTPQEIGGERWHPFVYQMGGENYNVRFSESSLLSEGRAEVEPDYDRFMADDLWDADDPVAWLEEYGVTEDFKQVGYLLYLTMRDGLKD